MTNWITLSFMTDQTYVIMAGLQRHVPDFVSGFAYQQAMSVDRHQGRIQGGGFSRFWEFFSNLLGFFRKKIHKPPLNFPSIQKKNQTSSKNFYIRP